MKRWWENDALLVPDAWLDSFRRFRRKVPILVKDGPALLLLACPGCGDAWMAPAGVPCRRCGGYFTQEQAEASGFARIKSGKATLQRPDGTPYLTRVGKKSLK